MTTAVRNFLHTGLCDLLEIEYPIMCSGMGSVTGPELVAAVSNAGGFGALGTGREGPQEMRAAIARVRSLTDKPFGVQLAARTYGDTPHARPQLPPEHVAFVKDLKRKFNIPDARGLPPLPSPEETRKRARAVFDAVLQERPAALVTSYGNPGKMVAEAHAQGIKVLSLVGNTRHVRHCLEAGADVLIATGYDAGGHGGQIGTMALVPQVVDAAGGVPVMAAGGIMDGRGLVAALALGAVGVNCGSAFLLCHEAGPFADSDLPPLGRDESLAPWRVSDLRRQLIEAAEYMTVQSREYSGGPLRKLATPWTAAWQSKAAPEPLPTGGQQLLIREAMRGAYEARRSDLLPNLVGQGVGMLREMRPARQVVFGMVQQALELLQRQFVDF